MNFKQKSLITALSGAAALSMAAVYHDITLPTTKKVGNILAEKSVQPTTKNPIDAIKAHEEGFRQFDAVVREIHRKDASGNKLPQVIKKDIFTCIFFYFVNSFFVALFCISPTILW